MSSGVRSREENGGKILKAALTMELLVLTPWLVQRVKLEKEQRHTT